MHVLQESVEMVYEGPQIKKNSPGQHTGVTKVDVIVSMGSTQQRKIFHVGSGDTWRSLKNKIAHNLNKSPNSILLTFHDKPCKDNDRVTRFVRHNHNTVLCTVHKDSLKDLKK